MAAPDCIVCAIGRGEAPARIVHAAEQMLAFMDILPVTPGHLLVNPGRTRPFAPISPLMRVAS